MKKIFSLLTFIFLNGAVMPLIGAIQYDIREERDRIQQERDRRRQIKLEEEMKNYIAMIKNVNLGVIRHNNKQSIFENLPKKYPRYANFTLKIEIPINNYDYSNEHYWAFVRFKSFTTRQNEDALTVKVIFNTEDNLSQKIKTILENQEIQNWVNDFRQFSDNVKFLIDTVIPKLDYNAEILWVFNTIETLKTYLREFTNIINIIKIQLQLKKIYYWKSDIEQEINQLKQQIKKYQDNLDLIRNHSHSNNNFNVLTDCSNYGFLTASVLGISAGFSLLFPPLAATIAFLSAISAGITSTIASTCSILE